MDPVLKAAVAADLARALVPYRLAAEEDALRQTRASVEALATLAARVDGLAAATARKAELANVYHRETSDALLAAAAAAAAAELAGMAQRLAESQATAVAALRAEAARAREDVAARLAEKLSADVWPGELQQVQRAAEDAASRVLAQWRPPASLALAGLSLALKRDFPGGAEEARRAGLGDYDVYRTGDALRVLLPK
jgi:hypothetical protein